MRFRAIIGLGLMAVAAAGCVASGSGEPEHGTTGTSTSRGSSPAPVRTFTLPPTDRPTGPTGPDRPTGPTGPDRPTGTVGPVTSSPGSASETQLTIVFGTGPDESWTLSCAPAGGSHPDPDTACRVLAAAGEQALPPVARDTLCAMIYGGPERATVTGRWRGTRINSSFSRTNSCQIGRWTALIGLLPRPGA